MPVDVTFFDHSAGRQTISFATPSNSEVRDLIHFWSQHFSNETTSVLEDFYVLCNGRRLRQTDGIEDGRVYHIVPRIFGGKGGFGSMLRAIGAQIEKTTSREACRDLSGRRMRDINNEKKLKEWLSKEADREREKEEKKAERLAKHLNPPQHKFEDKQYHEQKEKVQEDLEDALQTGLKRAMKKADGGSGPSQSKRPKVESSRKEWLGVDIDSDDSDNSDLEADPGFSEGATASFSKPAPHSDGEISSHSSSSLPQSSISHSHTDDSSQDVKEERIQDVKSEVTEDCSESQFITDAANVSSDEGSAAESATKAKSPSKLLSSLPPPIKSEDEYVQNEGGDLQVKTENEDATDDADIPEGPIDLDSFLTETSLCRLGLERLKTELMTRGLKCGGTLEERASRLFSVRGMEPGDYPSSLLAKAKGKGKKSK